MAAFWQLASIASLHTKGFTGEGYFVFVKRKMVNFHKIPLSPMSVSTKLLRCSLTFGKVWNETYCNIWQINLLLLLLVILTGTIDHNLLQLDPDLVHLISPQHISHEPTIYLEIDLLQRPADHTAVNI